MLRSLWFNSTSPEVIICFDYLHEHGRRMILSIEVKEMFCDGEVTGDGKYTYYVCVNVRRIPGTRFR